MVRQWGILTQLLIDQRGDNIGIEVLGHAISKGKDEIEGIEPKLAVFVGQSAQMIGTITANNQKGMCIFLVAVHVRSIHLNRLDGLEIISPEFARGRRLSILELAAVEIKHKIALLKA